MRAINLQKIYDEVGKKRQRNVNPYTNTSFMWNKRMNPPSPHRVYSFVRTWSAFGYFFLTNVYILFRIIFLLLLFLCAILLQSDNRVSFFTLCMVVVWFCCIITGTKRFTFTLNVNTFLYWIRKKKKADTKSGNIVFLYFQITHNKQ